MTKKEALRDLKEFLHQDDGLSEWVSWLLEIDSIEALGLKSDDLYRLVPDAIYDMIEKKAK